MEHYFQDIVNRINQRSSEATLSLLSITHPGLRRHLNDIYARPISSPESFLADPVFELLFGWKEDKATMADLAGDLLQPTLVDAMDKPAKEFWKEFSFKKNWNPYRHQIEAWRKLCRDDAQSIVVTSGTGSGKTECFVVPVLNDLISEFSVTRQPLIGTRALFIYPLNALINSQRERLRAWTGAFGSNIRFCLYNGNTKENSRAILQSETPNEILSRVLLRREPAPILVTNATMLEYMLVRQVDAPILDQSQGKLRWIVLDEAHTYVGSQAAELALLLRRVMYAFGVEAQDIRFVATSATIGDTEGNEKLKNYLASIAGIDEQQITVIGGSRSVPELQPTPESTETVEQLRAIDTGQSISANRYKKLSGNMISRKIRDHLVSKSGPATLSELTAELYGEEKVHDSVAHQKTLSWLDICSDTKNEKDGKSAESFLPLRAHLFHQVQSGLWCCADAGCTSKKGTALETEWPFGFVYTNQRVSCDCGAPVYELTFCVECNEPHLKACDTNGRLVQSVNEIIDEFSLQVEDESDEEDGIQIKDMVVLAPVASEDTTVQVTVSRQSFEINSPVDTFPVNFCINNLQCANCRHRAARARAVFRSCLLGTPFYVSNTVPSLLEFCEDGHKPNESPGRGRRLITFTDSRQGTARIAAKIQQDSERDRVRGIIYSVAAENSNVMSSEKIEKAANKYEESEHKLRAAGFNIEAERFKELAEEERKKLTGRSNLTTVRWTKMVSRLRANPDINTWMLKYYQRQNPALFSDPGGEQVLAEMLLIREFARRPKRQNSLETLGLVGVIYPALKDVSPPREWERLGVNRDDWLAFLKLALDFYVRGNTIIDVPKGWINWMGGRIYPKVVMSPDTDEKISKGIMRWPLATPQRNSRLVRILSYQCNLDLSNAHDRDRINEIMRAVWRTLTGPKGVLSQVPATLYYHLKRDKLAFRLITNGFACPVTQRIIDSTFKRVTPYLPPHPDGNNFLCSPVKIPSYRPDVSQFRNEKERIQNARDWIQDQPEIAKLRQQNLWTDLSDRIIEGGRYFRAAEHSAQQSATKLSEYENCFKRGKLNVLSCSTTMEMGVDIGGLSQVAMNNVPPHPANYLQRVGRAGRRGETQALGFTICKDNPHDRNVFADPMWPFKTHVPSPHVTLDSTRIVERHINSMILAHFFRHVMTVTQKQTTVLNCGWFFHNEMGDLTPADNFIDWLEKTLVDGIPIRLRQGLGSLVIRTPFSGVDPKFLVEKTKKAIIEVKDNWEPEHNRILEEFEAVADFSKNDPYKHRVERDLRSIQNAYLLAELATKSFLPGYGFPTGIAIFDPYNVHVQGLFRSQNDPREDNISRVRDKPGRDLPIALREYSPGATVVLDGLVYKSAGISLNRFADADVIENQLIRIEYRCATCGHIENVTGTAFDRQCAQCDAAIRPIDERRYLKPTGFAVDFYVSPTTDVSHQPFIKTQEPWVTASNELQSLPTPELGKFRASRNGHIFHHVSGENGTGYAVCLRCGRAEGMLENGEYPASLRPGTSHRKLRGKPGGEATADCDGPDSTHLIAHNLHLGATDQTDVFELYLKRPVENHYFRHSETVDDTRRLTWTLSIVLRQALADILGVNASEMGYAVKPSKLADCNYAVAGIVLFDECGGGAGFASSAPQHLADMFHRAHRYLECPTECTSACQSCLMGHDTRFHHDLLDRHLVLQYLDNDFFNRLDLAKDLKIFGDSTSYMYESITTAVTQSIQSGSEDLTVFLTGSPNEWDLASSGLKKHIVRWVEQFKNVQLALCVDDITKLDESVREDLWLYTQLGAKTGLISDDSNIVLQTSSDNCVMTIGSSKSSTTVPNADFWSIPEQVLLRSNEFPKVTGIVKINHDSLHPHFALEDKEVEITNELNGEVSEFGNELWKHLADQSDFLKKKLSDGDNLVEVTYSDRYLYTPWTVILVTEILGKLKCLNSVKWHVREVLIETGNRKDNRQTSNRGFFANWNDHQTRLKVTKTYLSKFKIASSVFALEPTVLPHGRVLKLTWQSGTTITLRFDQGVGYWRGEQLGRLGFLNHLDTPEKQASEMVQALRHLEVEGQRHPTQVFIKAIPAA